MKFINLILLPLFVLITGTTAFTANEALIAEIAEKARITGSDSLLIVQNGQAVYSNFFGTEDQPRGIMSITKSICATAIGQLIEDGKIPSVDVPMSRWFPAWANDRVKSKITLKMILNHTSGISDTSVPDFFLKPDFVQVASQTPPLRPVGGQFEYSNIATSLLQKVIADSSGQSVGDFVNVRIFAPIGITDSVWVKDRAGHEITAGGLALTTADLLKLGRLMLNQGVWDGKTIFKHETHRWMLTKSQNYRAYGLLWWLHGRTVAGRYSLYSAIGLGGQYITVYPAKNLIAIRTKDTRTIDDDKWDVQSFPEFRSLIEKWE